MLGFETRLRRSLVNLRKAKVLIFPLQIHEVFLICRAGRASVNCPQNELRKIFWMPYFREGTFINGKKAAHPSLQLCSSAQAVLWFVGSAERREQQIAGAEWTLKPHITGFTVVFGACVCHLLSVPESININDGWKYFSLSTFHFSGRETVSPLNVFFSSKHECSPKKKKKKMRGQCPSAQHFPWKASAGMMECPKKTIQYLIGWT